MEKLYIIWASNSFIYKEVLPIHAKFLFHFSLYAMALIVVTAVVQAESL